MPVDFDSFKLLLEKFTLTSILPAILYLLVGLFVIRMLLSFLNNRLGKSNIDVTLHRFLSGSVKLVLYFILFMMVASALGIQVTSLVAVLSVAGLAVSLSVQGLLSNVLSGLMLLFIKPFKVGDYVEVGGVGGFIKEIGFVHTKILSFENILIYMPNSEVSNGKITNYSTEEKRRFNLNFTVSYDCPPDKVREVLLEYVSSNPNIDNEPAPFVAVSKYKESSIEYVVRAWADNSVYWDAYWDIHNGMDALFKKNGLVMTYPHLNVHINNKSLEDNKNTAQ
ncbi:MAG: mechanosensitive ion channel family protein [Synergistaceae bacterium]|nr:mechanosensitive ion channel family protein [Synergistaceae bacterium]MBP9559862.1 mechanosensitive ion channel family protein [Synergistaceae bacterium]MBP9975233.1 mechanosensitive ion channel family protein [Synergistaceae bacterium]MDD4751159.1 mechanosensitive ion channel family protein [Synergistaceae bacterium]